MAVAERLASGGLVRRARRPAGWAAPGPGAAGWQRAGLAPRAGEAALLAVHELRRADEVGSIAPHVVEPPLVVRTRDGAWSDDFRGLRRDMGMP